MAAEPPDPWVDAPTRAQWRRWLIDNHATSAGVWLVRPRKAAGADDALGYVESVEEALCVGWVDSRARPLDDARALQWFSPRKRGSGWARTNKERIERLTAEGLMLPAGLAVVEQAKADGSWSRLDDAEALVMPDDLAEALAARPPARERFDAFPPSARKALLAWIALAKRPQTRAARVEETAARAQIGERANQWERRSPTP